MTENGASFAPRDGGKQFVRVRSVIEHFPGLKTFVFEADGVHTQKLAPQRAGNYIAITADAGESRVTRAYTLASSPKEAEGSREHTLSRPPRKRRRAASISPP